MKTPIEMLGDGKPLEPSVCPTCHYVMTAATCVNQGHAAARPRPNDVSVCLKCGEILVFDERLVLRIAELNDFVDLDEATNRTMLKAQKLIRRKRPLDK